MLENKEKIDLKNKCVFITGVAGFIGSNPRQPSQEEMEKLLKCCYYDTEVDF